MAHTVENGEVRERGRIGRCDRACRTMLTNGAMPGPRRDQELDARIARAGPCARSVKRPAIFSPRWRRSPTGIFHRTCVSGDAVAGSRAKRM